MRVPIREYQTSEASHTESTTSSKSSATKKNLVCHQRLLGAEFWAVMVHMGGTVSPGLSRESAIAVWCCARAVQKHPLSVHCAFTEQVKG